MAWRIFTYKNDPPSFWPANSTVYVVRFGGIADEYIVDDNNVPTPVGSSVIGQWLTDAGVPAASTIDGTYYRDSVTQDVYFRTGGTWVLVGSLTGGGGGGTGDVVGPSVSVSNNVALFDGVTGKLIKDSGLTLSGNNTGDQTITLTGAVTGSGNGTFTTTLANAVVGIANLSATGTPDATTFLRGDNVWASATPTFSTNLTVYLTGGKSVGKYTTGQTIPRIGKTMEQVLDDIAVEVIPPTLALSSPTSSIPFNTTSQSITLNFTKTINLPSTSIATLSLEFARSSAPTTWSVLTTNTALITYSHAFAESAPNLYNSDELLYRLVVTDNLLGSTTTPTLTISTAAYVAPSVSWVSSNLTRELGDVIVDSTDVRFTITRNSPLVDCVSYQLRRRVTTSGVVGAWADFGSAVSIGASGGTYNVADATLTAATTTAVEYAIIVTDGMGAGTQSSARTITLVHQRFVGYNAATSLTLPDILALANGELSNALGRTITATAGAGLYTYIVYASAAGPITTITQNGSLPVLGAFTELTIVTGNRLNMPIVYPEIIVHNNADLALIDSDFVRGGYRTVADTTALYALTSVSGVLGQLKENLTRVWVASENCFFRLIDDGNIGNAAGWAKDAYVFTQASPSATWIITHNLGKYPNVQVLDSGGDICEGEIEFNSTNQLTLAFSGSFSGTAYVS
jgi:hypothetical protein